MRVRPLVLALCLLAAVADAQAQLSKPRAGFGRAVAFAGDELLVGESQNEAASGFVYVYAKRGNTWEERAALKANDARAGDGFGASIARDGQRMLVGARGAAYLFERSASGWQQVAKLAATESTPADNFGSALALSGDLAVIGAPGQNNRTGAAYVFRRTSSGWTHEATLAAPEAKEQMQFGAAIAIRNGDVLVGEQNQNERTGGVHVFRKEGAAWKRHVLLLPANAQKGDRFGAGITVAADRVYLSAPGFLNNSGAVFSFERQPDGNYREVQRILAFDGRPGDQFGAAVGMGGEDLWIGAPGAQQFRGRVYHLFGRTPEQWSAVHPMAMEDAAQGDGFGAVAAAQGTLAAVAAPNDDVLLGSVTVYEFTSERRWQSVTLRRPAAAIASQTGGKRDCVNNHSGDFPCSDVELLSYVSADDLGAARGMMVNDLWGWTDPETGKEWALVGRMDGTSFVDISNPEKPIVVGNLPLTKGANPNLWRDIKVYKDHAFIVADGAGQHGMQVFDLTRLRKVTKVPAVFEPDTTYRGIHSSHNIVINEQSGYAYAVGVSGGGNTCGGGLHMIDIRNPKKPQFAGCFSDPQTGRANTGYSHDAQCITYHGPDQQYRGREICFGSNETMLSIADVTDKKNPKAVARSSYPDVGYSHQGWISDDHRYFYMDDELDEVSGTTPKTRTIIWDLTDLDDPQVAEMFLSPTAASDHNLYIKGDTMYQSHYKAGLRIVDISNRTKPVEIGSFDTVPYGDNTPGFGGSWSNYPYFKSGNIIATSMSEGLFVLRKKAPSKPVL